MSYYTLLDNDQVDWSDREYYYDNNGQAHAQYLHWGDDYTLEGGSAVDDIDAIMRGIYLFFIDDLTDEEWN